MVDRSVCRDWKGHATARVTTEFLRAEFLINATGCEAKGAALDLWSVSLVRRSVSNNVRPECGSTRGGHPAATYVQLASIILTTNARHLASGPGCC